ncbi:MAG: matrixin family metalloprotease [Isosphaeraceae bacterium]
MYASLPKLRSAACPATRKRTVRPLLENLEDRVLLYNTYGGDWVYGSRITYSFAPDGTSLGGTPSVLFQTLNAKFTQANWQLQFQKAAAVWQAVANINLSQVSDNGSIEGCSGNQQDDPRFGDIRIGMINLGAPSVLGETFLPPPAYGGTIAGDMFLNSAASWQINTDYDLETVAIHEFGHALGLGESQITTACMYAYYNGVKQSLTSDDIAGIQSIWGAPQPDQFNSNGLSNSNYTSPTNITSYIDSNDQIAIPNLRLLAANKPEWFTVTVPTNTTGTMVVTEQSTSLSMLSPYLYVYTSGLKPLASQSTTAYGATVSVSVTGVQAGQTYLIRAAGYSAGDPTGTFGLELNFGSQTQSPIPPPNTVVPQQPDEGGGIDYGHSQTITIGHLSGLGYVYSVNTNQGNGTKTPPPNNGAAGGTAKTVSAPQTTVGTAALVVTASAQPALLTSGNAAVSNAASSPAVMTPGSSPLALQALDDSLLTWKSKNPLSLFTKGNSTGAFLN